MNKLLKRLVLLGAFCFSSSAYAQLGINVGSGVPYVTQVGVNYFFSDKISAEVSFNQLSLTQGDADLELTKPEVNVKWHVFGGSFFVGVGFGSMTLESTGTDSFGNKATIDVTATATTLSLGWLWGLGNGGFFGGIDLGYQSPSGADADITIDDPSLGPGNPVFDDALELAEDVSETALPLVTFIRLGYIF